MRAPPTARPLSHRERAGVRGYRLSFARTPSPRPSPRRGEGARCRRGLLIARPATHNLELIAPRPQAARPASTLPRDNGSKGANCAFSLRHVVGRVLHDLDLSGMDQPGEFAGAGRAVV